VEANIFGTPIFMWLIAFVAIIILGVSKGGIKGISVILVTMLVYVYGGRTSTGVLMPLLIAADLVGTYIGKDLPEDLFKQAMIAIIIFSVLILLYWEKYPPKQIPDNWFFSSAMGLAAGVTTMIGNLAGPFANIYFLSMRLPKNEFIRTVAWLFFMINIFKLPIHIFYWKSVNSESILQSFSLIPALLTGFTLGAWLVTKIKDHWYRKMVIGATGIVALLLLFK